MLFQFEFIANKMSEKYFGLLEIQLINNKLQERY